MNVLELISSSGFSIDWQRQEGVQAAQQRQERQRHVSAAIAEPLVHLRQKLSARGTSSATELRQALLKVAPTTDAGKQRSVNEAQFAKVCPALFCAELVGYPSTNQNPLIDPCIAVLLGRHPQAMELLGISFTNNESRQAFHDLRPGPDGRLDIDTVTDNMRTSDNMVIESTDHAKNAAANVAVRTDPAVCDP